MAPFQMDLMHQSLSDAGRLSPFSGQHGAMASKEQYVSIDGNRLKLTSLDKVLYPETGTTKADVLDYYARIADLMIPHVANRPVTRKRWVNGVGTADKPGQVFFQKNLGDGAPDWVARRILQHKDHVNEYPLANDRATLAWLGQIGALEIHVPQWQFGRTGVQKNPDRLVLDLDPGEGAGLPECVEVAKLARSAILTDMGLDPMPVTSGSKGIHLYAALDGKQNSDQVSAIAHELARALEADHPDLIVSDMKKSLRGGKVLVDWSQNSAAKTTVAPYSLRGKLHPMVAAPRTWRELASADLQAARLHRGAGAREAARRPARRPHQADTCSRWNPPPSTRPRFEADGCEPGPARQVPLHARPEQNEGTDGRNAPGSAQEIERSDDESPSFVIQEHHAQAAALRLPAGARRRTGQLGGAEGVFRRTRARTTWRCRPKTTHWSTAPSREAFRQENTAQARSASGMPAPTSWRSGARARRSSPRCTARSTAATATP
jgi:bifunctional non-homologous end joining protein LigD